MTTRSFTIIILAHVCVFMISTSIAQLVIDTNSEPVEAGDEYFIRPAITGNGGTTLVNRNGSCPLDVGLDQNSDLPGLIVIFTPFSSNHDDDDVRLSRDLRVQFRASNCGQSSEWRLGERDATSDRRLITTGRDDGTVGSFGNFFRIVQSQTLGIYNIQWCPTEVCPRCWFACGTIGIIRENGKSLLALDGGDALPVLFLKE
jgi:hypothetical protein